MNPDTNRLDPGFDPRIADWLEADPDRAPREVLDTVLAALPSVPQRRALRVPWRFPEMLINRLAVTAVAIVIVIAGGAFAWSRLPGDGGVGTGPQPTQSPPTPLSSPSPSRTAPPSPSPSVITSAYVGTTLSPGTYKIDAFAAPFRVTLPGGWTVGDVTHHNVVFHSDSGFVTLVILDKVYRDPCHTETRPKAIGPRVDDLVTALTAMKGFRVTGVKDVTVGGAVGKSFTLENSIDLRADQCSRNDVLWIGTDENDGKDVPVLETAGSADLLWAVDAGGTTVLIGAPAGMIDAISFDAGSS